MNLPTPTPQIMVFDLGKVLLDFDWMIVIERLARKSGRSPDSFKSLISDPSLLLDYECGAISSRDFHLMVQNRLGYTGTFEEFVHDFGQMFSEIPEMIDINRSIRSRGIPTYILSNTNEIAIDIIQNQFPFFQEFTGYIYSYVEKSMKPDQGIYAALESMAQARGPEIAFIDDNLANVAGAQSRGWQAHHHQSIAETRQFLASIGLL